MRTLILIAFTSLALPVFAQPAVPTADEVDKVLNYFNDGKDTGPILVEAALCGKVDRKTKECVDPVTDKAEAKKTVELLMRWFVPKDGVYDDIRIEWIHEGEVRLTSDLKITTAYNYRTWKAKTLKKEGAWEIRIRRGDEIIKTIKTTAE